MKTKKTKNNMLFALFNLINIVLIAQAPATAPYSEYPQSCQIVLNGQNIGTNFNALQTEVRNIWSCKLRFNTNIVGNMLYHFIWSNPQFRYEDWVYSSVPQKVYKTTVCPANTYTLQDIFSYKLAQFSTGASMMPKVIECDQNFNNLSFTYNDPNFPIFDGNIFIPSRFNNVPFANKRYFKMFCATAYFRPLRGAGTFYFHVPTSGTHANRFKVNTTSSGGYDLCNVDSVLSTYDYSADQGNGDWDAFYQIRFEVDYVMGKPSLSVNKVCIKNDSALINLNTLVRNTNIYPGTFYNSQDVLLSSPYLFRGSDVGINTYKYKSANNGCVVTNTIGIYNFQRMSLATIPKLCNSSFTLTGGSPLGGQYYASATYNPNHFICLTCWHSPRNGVQGDVIPASLINTWNSPYITYWNVNYPCSDTVKQFMVKVRTEPIEIVSTSTLICSEDTVRLRINNLTTPTNIYPNIYWSTLDSSATIGVRPFNTMVYSVKATNVGLNDVVLGNCNVTNSIVITVKPTPTLSIALNTNSVCASNPIVLTGLSNGFINWSNISSTSNTVTLFPENSTTYAATSSHTLNTCTRYREIGIYVYPSPLIKANTWKRTIIQGQGTRFDSLTDINAFSNWNFGDGLTSNLDNPYHYYNASGTYSVQVTSTNSFGCTRTVKYNNIVIVTPFTVGIEELETSFVKLYPTVFNDFIYLNNSSSKILKFSVLNQLGQTILNNEVLGNENLRIDLGSLNNGLYYVKINGLNKIYKIIKND